MAQLRGFLAFERQMKRTGGPGIIPFELAGSTDRAHEILETWGPHGRSAAKNSLRLDYLFPPTYATLQALACDATAEGLAKRGRRALAALGGPIGWAQLAAAGFDYVENTALLLILAGRNGRAPGLARRAALVKFTLTSLGQGYMLLGGLDAARARSMRLPGKPIQPSMSADLSSRQRRRRARHLLFWRLANPVNRALAPIAPWWVVLETTGRRSGRPLQTPLARGPIEGNSAWLISVHGRHADWVRNLQANSSVRIRIRGRWRAGRASIHPYDPAIARRFNRYARAGPTLLGIEPALVEVQLAGALGDRG